MSNFVIISGCSSGGKSTLLQELSDRGFATVEEPGRRIVDQQLACGGKALPWHDPRAFIHQVTELAIKDRQFPRADKWIFFDRSLIDAASAMQAMDSAKSTDYLKSQFRYHNQVFLTPPWPEIYVEDTARRHSLQNAMEEYNRLLTSYPDLGYEINVIPKINVSKRADYVLTALGIGPTSGAQPV